MIDAANNALGTVFTRAGLWRGVIAVQPLALGVFVYGVTFGLLSVGSGLSGLQAALLSAGVNSGSAQTAAVGALASGAGLTATALSVMLLNARYLFYGAALRSWLEGASGSRAYITLFFVGDGNWLLSMRARALGEVDAGFILGSGLCLYVAWLSGTVLVVSLGSVLPPPEALGLDFLLVAFCTAMVAEGFRARPIAPMAWSGLAAVTAALTIDVLALPGWAPLAAGCVGVLTAYVRHRAEDESSK